jgi:hypothetical protein
MLDKKHEEMIDYALKKFYREETKRDVIGLVIDTTFRGFYAFLVIQYFPELISIFSSINQMK